MAMPETTMPSERNREPAGRQEATRTTKRYLPQVDIFETDNELVLEADMPGVCPQDLAVEFEQGILTISGKVGDRLPDKRYLLREYGVGDFHRAFQIDSDIDPTAITAELAGGVLTCKLPKVKAARPRKIPVRAG
jgi:HSP20 family protein